MRRALAVTTAAAALGLSACGGDGNASSGSGQSSRERAQDGALKFAECMRENGVDMPDPEVGENGGIRIQVPEERGRVKPDNNPKVDAAHEKCEQHLQSGLNELSTEQRAELRDAGVKYAECMRGKGIDMPDPSAEGGMQFRFRAGEPGAVNPESPKFREAHEACEQHLAKVRPGAKEESP